MITISDDELPLYQVLGTTLRINHSHSVVDRIDTMTELTKTEQHYITAICDITADRNTKIEAVMASVYSPSAEIATINNKESEPELYADYQAFRILAKTLADGWVYQ
jgi:tRNA isopentenyl-2-thiomethyl-A-37 hydroxylase MiaE